MSERNNEIQDAFVINEKKSASNIALDIDINDDYAIVNCRGNIIDTLDIFSILKDSDKIIVPAYLINIKYFPRNSEKENFLTIDNILDFKTDRVGLPVIRENIRADMYKFVNRALTEYTNFLLKTGYYEIAFKDRGEIDILPSTIVIDNYSNDVFELDKMAKKDNMLKEALIENYIEYEPDDELKGYITQYLVDDENLLPLVFIYRANLLKPKKVLLPDIELFNKGFPFKVEDLYDILPGSGVRESNIKSDRIFIIPNGHSFLVLRKLLNDLVVVNNSLNQIWVK